MLLFQYIFCKRCVFCCSTDADSITTNNKLPISNILPCQVSLRKSKKSVFVSENNSLRSLRNATLVRDLIVKIPLMLTHRDWNKTSRSFAKSIFDNIFVNFFLQNRQSGKEQDKCTFSFSNSPMTSSARILRQTFLNPS